LKFSAVALVAPIAMLYLTKILLKLPAEVFERCDKNEDRGRDKKQRK
jgi:hypothetical protein